MANTYGKLSVIIPTLNEAATLASLLRGLQIQQQIILQIIIVDAGSQDNTLAIAEDFLVTHGMHYQLETTTPGRAAQLNRGAQIAEGEDLLFLHADTTIHDRNLLVNAVNFLETQRQALQSQFLAGHFGLGFRRERSDHQLAYYFYESKTRLNRLDTINGDQGFMLSKRFFTSLGGFDESLNYMEDARLARKIFSVGQWITLPGALTTSARRFETEGLKQRQILNALLCNFDHIGLTEFFTEAASAYRSQTQTGVLALQPFFAMIHKLSKRKGLLQTTRLWFKTGAYVAGNAWQLAFALDCRRNFAKHLSPGEGPTPVLTFYDRWLKPLIDSPPGHLIAAVLTFIWFYSSLLLLVLRK